MDASDVAVDKARALADTKCVTVDFHVADIATWDWDEPQTLRYAITLNCSMGDDGGQ